MTRSVAGKNLTGRLVTASAGVAAIFALALVAGCSAGQIAETAKIQSSVPGGNASVSVPVANNPNSLILLRNVTVDTVGADGYAKGGSAPLTMSIVNQTPYQILMAPSPQAMVYSPDGVLSAIGTLTLAGGSSNTAGANTSPSASASASASTPPSAGASSAPSTPAGSAPASPGPSGPPSPSPSASAPIATVSIAPAKLITLTDGSGQFLQITNLSAALQPGAVVQVEFEFVAVDSNGTAVGEYTQLVTAPIAPPDASIPRESLVAPSSANNG